MKTCSGCGQQLPEESVFCNKCGTQMAPTQKEQSFSSGNKRGKTSTVMKKYKFMFAAAGIIIVAAAVVGLIRYNANQSNYRDKIESAQYNVEQGNFDGAYTDIMDLSPKSKDKELFERIQLVKFAELYSPMDYQLYEEANYESILDRLLDGIAYCRNSMDRANELGVGEDLQTVQMQLAAELDEYYGINENEIEQLASMNETVRADTITELAQQAKPRIKDAIQEDSNP
ncbi:zinc ribbon domain-containing protein [Paenibacillus glufosinatiresistens]|uniref:zinc ribbon domain-containing protein n=1 Tax=Paenibacillus glufosinatiresistens TaxID=3070657 RepID=UPI00286E6DC9|nr:zinc ribbon domain-containing protein [Paenibacillus sp. YX.27]